MIFDELSIGDVFVYPKQPGYGRGQKMIKISPMEVLLDIDEVIDKNAIGINGIPLSLWPDEEVEFVGRLEGLLEQKMD